MKKTVLLFCAILMLLGNAVAQNKNVALAKAKITGDNPDRRAAKELIVSAMKDPSTINLARTWFTAGEVFSSIYSDQQKQFWTQKSGDQGAIGESLKSSFDCFLKADSLDQLPNEKGKIKPKFRTRIVDYLKTYQRGFTDAGSYFYEKKDYKKALSMFETYLKYKDLPALKGLGLEKDTFIPLITYYCGLCASQAQNSALSVKYFELIKDSSKDSKWIYSKLSEDYTSMKDTANMLRIYKLGATKFPEESFYVRNLVNFYLGNNKLKEALLWIDQAIKLDPASATLWNVKGRMLENDKQLVEATACFKKALEIDPNYAEALGSIGRIYYNTAVIELDKVSLIKDEKMYKAEKPRLKTLFEAPRPYYEKAHALNPNEREYVVALRGIYYNLNLDLKYKEMEKILSEMTK